MTIPPDLIAPYQDGSPPRPDTGLPSPTAAGQGHGLPTILALGKDTGCVTAVGREESFNFHCHAGVTCFTECCRELELALPPYDVVRLRVALGQTAQQFLDEYAVIEFTAADIYPKVYLAMVDDGRASCPFVTASGCRVYADRPAACRTYPLARGASCHSPHEVREQFVIIHEPHCQGFAETKSQSVTEWLQEQDLDCYNRCNDLILPLLMDAKGEAKARFTDAEATLYLDTMYGLDRFQAGMPSQATTAIPVPMDTKDLITLAVSWLAEQWLTAR